MRTQKRNPTSSTTFNSLAWAAVHLSEHSFSSEVCFLPLVNSYISLTLILELAWETHGSRGDSAAKCVAKGDFLASEPPSLGSWLNFRFWSKLRWTQITPRGSFARGPTLTASSLLRQCWGCLWRNSWISRCRRWRIGGQRATPSVPYCQPPWRKLWCTGEYYNCHQEVVSNCTRHSSLKCRASHPYGCQWRDLTHPCQLQGAFRRPISQPCYHDRLSVAASFARTFTWAFMSDFCQRLWTFECSWTTEHR